MKDIKIVDTEIELISNLSKQLTKKLYDADDNLNWAGESGFSGYSLDCENITQSNKNDITYYNELSMIVSRLKMIQHNLLTKIRLTKNNNKKICQ
jgi:hypothetical protein